MEFEYFFLVISSTLWGFFLKLNDLSIDDGVKFFKRSDILISFTTSFFGIFTLFFSPISIKIFWFGVILSWILRGKIDHYFHGLWAFLMIFYLLQTTNPSLYTLNLLAVFIPLSIIGFIHDRIKEKYKLKFNKKRLSISEIVFLKNFWVFWVILSIIYSFYFDNNFLLIFSVIGFLAGYTIHYSKFFQKIFKKYRSN